MHGQEDAAWLEANDCTIPELKAEWLANNSDDAVLAASAMRQHAEVMDKAATSLAECNPSRAAIYRQWKERLIIGSEELADPALLEITFGPVEYDVGDGPVWFECYMNGALIGIVACRELCAPFVPFGAKLRDELDCHSFATRWQEDAQAAIRESHARVVHARNQ